MVERQNIFPEGLSKRVVKTLRLARDLDFTNDIARVIDNIDAGVLERTSSQQRVMALLLLMLEARSHVTTSFHHQPEAQHPNSSAINKLPADYPIYSVAMG